jgi:hypothetical protein
VSRVVVVKCEFVDVPEGIGFEQAYLRSSVGRDVVERFVEQPKGSGSDLCNVAIIARYFVIPAR